MPPQVRLCLDKQDFIRAQILSRKISPKAFVERKGEGKGEIGIEGTAIEAADEVGNCAYMPCFTCPRRVMCRGRDDRV